MTALKTGWIVVFFLLSFDYQTKPLINIERVRQDLLNSQDDFVPENFIKKRNKNFFYTLYAGEYCFVHLNYKDYASECFMKSSVVAIYKLDKNEWILKNTLPYYYNISLIDEGGKIFFSNNEFCSPDGQCHIYSEVNFYDGNDFKSFISYEGFNKLPYYDNLLGTDKMDELKKVVGDTIANEFHLSDFNIVPPNHISFELSRRIILLQSFSDRLKTKTITSSSVVKVVRQ